MLSSRRAAALYEKIGDLSSLQKVRCLLISEKKKITHRGARTHDHQIKSLALYRLS